MIAPAKHTERFFRQIQPNDLIRFASKIKVDPETGCWLWQGYCDKKGYGQFRFAGRIHWAHRFSYALFVGEIETGMTIHHTCNNPQCVNPTHLALATVGENATEGNNRRWKNGYNNVPEPDFC